MLAGEDAGSVVLGRQQPQDEDTRGGQQDVADADATAQADAVPESRTIPATAARAVLSVDSLGNRLVMVGRDSIEGIKSGDGT